VISMPHVIISLIHNGHCSLTLLRPELRSSWQQFLTEVLTPRADSYHGGVTALHLAAQNGHLGTVKLLIDRNANVDARDQCGDTPLCYAAMCHGGHPDVVEVLLNHGAEVNARDNKGRTILDRLNLDEPKEMKRFLVDLLKSRSGHEAI
jgi:ankyrin repeat protein